MRSIPSSILLGLAVLALTACAKDQGEFPSLARRPAERLNTPLPEATPSPAPSPAAADPVLLTRIAALEAKAQAAHARFQTKAPQARAAAAAAAGAPVASENWSVATVALSELEAARSEAVIALAELDSLYARAVVDGTDSPALGLAREKVMALIGEEDGVLAELQARLAD